MNAKELKFIERINHHIKKETSPRCREYARRIYYKIPEKACKPGDKMSLVTLALADDISSSDALIPVIKARLNYWQKIHNRPSNNPIDLGLRIYIEDRYKNMIDILEKYCKD